MGTPKIFLRSAVFGILLILSADAFGQYFDNDLCCDPTNGTAASAFTCQSAGEPQESSIDEINCDINCGPVAPGCTTIPLDGGLSLLAIAGGGLATAAMRRRREEELLEKEA